MVKTSAPSGSKNISTKIRLQIAFWSGTDLPQLIGEAIFSRHHFKFTFTRMYASKELYNRPPLYVQHRPTCVDLYRMRSESFEFFMSEAAVDTRFASHLFSNKKRELEFLLSRSPSVNSKLHLLQWCNVAAEVQWPINSKWAINDIKFVYNYIVNM